MSLLLIVVLIAGLYMAWNIGANDVANAMGTSVGSGALTLRQAVILASVLEFCGALFFGSHVSETIQRGIVDTSLFQDSPLILVYGMLAALVAAGFWLQLASYFGLPVSTTHSIVGAVVGFGVMATGIGSIHWDQISLILSTWVLSPFLGGLIAYLAFTLIRRQIFSSQDPVSAAKQLTLPLAFISFFILSLLFLSKGLKTLALGFPAALLLACLIALIGSLFIHKRLRKITSKAPSPEKRPPLFTPAVTLNLEKARKQLARAQAATEGEVSEQIARLRHEIEGLSSAARRQLDEVTTSAEYRAVERIFGYLQILTASTMAFAHGANDVANAIGPLAAAVSVLLQKSFSQDTLLPSLLALGGIGIIAGLATWGWRVIETIGKKITELTPTRGFSAELGASTTILLATRLGIPISTTHTLVGAVIGVGLARGIEALNLQTTRNIVLSWLVTFPCGALLAALFFQLFRWGFSH